MKKTLTFAFAALMVCAFAFVGCKGSKNSDSPKAYIDEVYGAMKSNDWAKVVDMMPGADTMSKESKDDAIAMMGLFQAFTGGVKDYEIISEEVAPDGKSATVKVKVTYGNGETETNTDKLVKTDKGWAAAADKDDTSIEDAADAVDLLEDLGEEAAEAVEEMAE
jgi:hypothetical protein